MKTALFSTLLCTFSSAAVLALNPPLSSGGFQSIFLGATSSDFHYANRSITAMNNDLRIIFMGNTGVNTGIWAEFGWNDETGVLAEKRTIPDGVHINPPELEYEWIPLEFRVSGSGDTLPTSGIGAGIFPGNAMTGPTYTPTLVASPYGKLGMVGSDGNFVSKWYACDGASWGSTISWSFDEGTPANPNCVSLSVFKVNNPRG